VTIVAKPAVGFVFGNSADFHFDSRLYRLIIYTPPYMQVLLQGHAARLA
jgi:hypothetical protein